MEAGEEGGTADSEVFRGSTGGVQRRETWRWRWQDEGRESFPPVETDIFEVFKENSFSGPLKGGCVSQ